VFRRIAICLVVGCVSGCGLAPGAVAVEQPVTDAEGENVGSSSQALNGAYAEFYARQGTRVLLNWPTSQQFCVLSGARGTLPVISVSQPNDGDWELEGWSYTVDQQAAAWALCFRNDNFYGLANSVFWHGECRTQDRNCWWGDAATAIHGIYGFFEGGGEYVKVFQSSSATTPSTIVAYEGSEGQDIAGRGRSLFYGVPSSGRLVRLMGYNTNGAHARGTMLSSGTFAMSASTYSGYSTYWLTPIQSGFCYFSKFGGDLNGMGEIGRISPVNGFWFLDTIAGSGDVWTTARCMAWNQG